jgi:hypothetical protein
MSSEQIDSKVWERKDILNSRMSALKAASVVMEGSNSPTATSDVLVQANNYFAWLIQDQDWSQNIVNRSEETNGDDSPGSTGDNNVVPVPTKSQMNWLEKIEKNYKFTKEDVWKKCGKYPNNKDEAVEITKRMKE